MENIEKLLKQILQNQIEMQKDLKEIKFDLSAVKEQTANLTVFKGETNQNFADIKDTLKFLLHKEVETEKEIFKLKQVSKKRIY